MVVTPKRFQRVTRIAALLGGAFVVPRNNSRNDLVLIDKVGQKRNCDSVCDMWLSSLWQNLVESDVDIEFQGWTYWNPGSWFVVLLYGKLFGVWQRGCMKSRFELENRLLTSCQACSQTCEFSCMDCNFFDLHIISWPPFWQ